MFKDKIVSLLAKNVRLKKEEIECLIEIPPNPDLGDYAFPCFVLAKKEKSPPNKIAEKLIEKINIKNIKEIDKIQASGAYLNFFIDKKILAENILKINANFGKTPIGKKKKIVIDFSAPNIGKPMHIGHIRSTIIGDSLMRIYKFLDYDPVGINYLGDIGLHIGKLIVAYELWLNKRALKKDPVSELLRLYVKFCAKEKTKIQEGMDEEFQDNEWTLKAKEKLKLLELGDKKTLKIWKDIVHYSGKGFKRVYDLLKVEFNETVGQSEFSEKGKQMVFNAVKKKIAKFDEDGAVYVEHKGTKKYILRKNKTASYITYDLGAAYERYKKYKFEKMIYVTDFRQKDHFKHLFNILELMGYSWSKKLVHLGFGAVRFGKEIIKTREGEIILLEEVLKRTIEKAREEIKKRKTKGDAEKIGVGAGKYIILKNDPSKDVQFSWESALNFEGNSAPYLQYSYARASSILKKAGNFNKKIKKIPDLTREEINLIKKISDFPKIVIDSEKNLNPALIANYSFELSQLFNEFYHTNKVIGSKEEAFRLCLVQSFRTALKNSLYLLGIEVMEEM